MEAEEQSELLTVGSCPLLLHARALFVHKNYGYNTKLTVRNDPKELISVFVTDVSAL